jgi:hypothetical protein
VDVALVTHDAVLRANLDALIAVDAARRFDHVRAVVRREVADGVGRADAAAQAAVDARVEEDTDSH